jgi:plastocyanin
MRKRIFTSAVAILALGSIALPAVADARGVHVRKVRLEDRCDPASFNLVIGEGTCIPHDNGNITFAEFAEELNPDDFGHDKWRNKPDELDLRVGDRISVTVRGGEFHTFTEVDEFGAGCVDELNIPLGLSNPPSPEQCGEWFATTGVAPNGLSTLTVSDLDVGTHKFMCIIHPWMTTVVKVK